MCIAIVCACGEKVAVFGKAFFAVAAAAVAFFLGLTLQGCTLAAYGLGVATMANDSVVRHNEEYASYVRRAEVENIDRSQAGLPEREILSRRAWSRQTGTP